MMTFLVYITTLVSNNINGWHSAVCHTCQLVMPPANYATLLLYALSKKESNGYHTGASKLCDTIYSKGYIYMDHNKKCINFK